MPLLFMANCTYGRQDQKAGFMGHLTVTLTDK